MIISQILNSLCMKKGGTKLKISKSVTVKEGSHTWNIHRHDISDSCMLKEDLMIYNYISDFNTKQKKKMNIKYYCFKSP